MASFLSQASSYFGRTNISANYTIDEKVPAVYAGLWKIQRAHRSGSASSNGAGPSSSASGASSDGRTAVSIWTHTFTSKGGERQAIAETLKKEASSLTRLRHPCVLETQEPLEETRNELIFATEAVLAPLSEALIASESSGRASDNVQLDEVEIQKGLLQVARGLEFLHSARMIHGNLTPDAILINAKGDWKLGGFSFLTPLTRPDGTPSPCILDYDPSLPPQLSRDFNYVAPEYALDDKLDPGNDMYSLGCVVYAIHNRGDPPFRNRNAVANIRSNADRLGSITGNASWAKMGRDVLGLLATLLTRFPGGRPNAAEFQNSEYFNNVLVRTLKFMERDNFAGRSREERVQFLKGLLKIMEQFSQRLQRRKVLPALLELMNDRSLLPFILPNVFVISTNLSLIEFTNNVLPKLKPLFSLQDPPQNQLILLDQMELFVSKTSPPVFREEVTPLLYSALEAEQVIVQERALQTVPRLCQVLEYAHVKEVTYPALVKLFVSTRTLSCKIQTLMCFHSMIEILDKHTITEKLVPVLARVKTREPSVMIAILAVDEAMSKKLDRETLAVHIIPQLWSMSVSAKLTAEQFQRFMKTVREMGDRVEREHLEYLKEQRHLQEQTESYTTANGSHQGGGLGGGVTGIGGSSGEIDFATLVGSAAGGNSSSAIVAKDTGANANDPFGWDDLASGPTTPSLAANAAALTPTHTGTASGLARAATTRNASSTILPGGGFNSQSTGNNVGGHSPSSTSPSLRPSSSSSHARSALSPPPPSSSRAGQSVVQSRPATATPPPGWSGSSLTPSLSASSRPAPPTNTSFSGSSSSGPNYNISLEPASNFGSGGSSALSLSTNSGALPPLLPQTSSLASLTHSAPGTTSNQSTVSAASGLPGPPGWGGAVLQPSRSNGSKAAQKPVDWGDFDPLK